MGETKHTPEPWYCEDLAPSHSGDANWCVYPETDDGFICHLGMDDDRPVDETAANAARIVACVNACAGIENPAAIGELVEAAEAAEYWLTEEARVYETGEGNHVKPVCILETLRAALAKVKRNSD